MTLVQTKKITRVPIVLVGKEYWGGLIDWIVNTMLHKENNISAADLNLIPVTDDPEEVVSIIRDFYQDHEEELSPNYSLD